MDIKGYENYTIDLDGNVWSKRSKKYLKPATNKNGYLQLILRKNMKSYTERIHRLVAKTYLPNIRNKPSVDHKDRNITNNRLFNLRWVNQTENNLNSKVRKNNTGYKNICYLEKKKLYQLTIMSYKKKIVNRQFSISKWTLEQVVEIRNRYYEELNIYN